MNDYSYVKGFNYQPSYAYNSYEAWRFYDSSIFDKEIGLGKKLFPQMNTLRLWLSYDAFRYEENRQVENFENALKICDKYGCKVIACLFNCWHDSVMDNGGMYHPMMIPSAISCSTENMYDSYFQKIVAAHKDDERILIWDICNEPYSFGNNKEYMDFMEPYETAWLKKMCDMCHETGAVQPCGISHFPISTDWGAVEKTADFTDVFLIHPYYFFSDYDLKSLSSDGFENLLNLAKNLSIKYNKPILTTETCWGSRDNKVRGEIIEKSLSAHKKANIGYVVHALHWSHVADLHDDSEGPSGNPGNLMFITRDNKLRECHEVFNNFLDRGQLYVINCFHKRLMLHKKLKQKIKI